MNLFEPENERISKKEIEDLQIKSLRKNVEKVYSHTEMYHTKFKESDIHPSDIVDLEDLQSIPFTTKEDHRRYSIKERLAIPEIEIVRFFSSSGSTGKPVAFGFSLKDLEAGAICCAKTFSSAGILESDKVLQPIPAGLYSVSVAQKGLELIGAKVIHTGPGRTKDLQIPILSGAFEESMKPTALISSASYATRIAEVAQESGKDPKDFNLKKLICGGDYWSESKRKFLQDAFDSKAYDVYGLIEASGGPCVAAECSQQNGMHVWENYFIIEIIDPETGENLSEGEEGEIVITSLQKDAHPIIRYRTGDISKIHGLGECSCGRTGLRIGRLGGRTDDRVKFRGVQIYPSALEEEVLSYPGTGSEYKVEITESGGVDQMKITVEGKADRVAAPFFSSKLASHIKGVLNVTPIIELVPIGTLPRHERNKVKRFFDSRHRR
jgi:phenylacetate-CoA ligase